MLRDLSENASVDKIFKIYADVYINFFRSESRLKYKLIVVLPPLSHTYLSYSSRHCFFFTQSAAFLTAIIYIAFINTAVRPR